MELECDIGLRNAEISLLFTFGKVLQLIQPKQVLFVFVCFLILFVYF